MLLEKSAKLIIQRLQQSKQTNAEPENEENNVSF